MYLVRFIPLLLMSLKLSQTFKITFSNSYGWCTGSEWFFYFNLCIQKPCKLINYNLSEGSFGFSWQWFILQIMAILFHLSQTFTFSFFFFFLFGELARVLSMMLKEAVLWVHFLLLTLNELLLTFSHFCHWYTAFCVFLVNILYQVKKFAIPPFPNFCIWILKMFSNEFFASVKIVIWYFSFNMSHLCILEI